MLKPVSFTTNGETKKYSVREEVKREFTSPLRMEPEGNLYGIYWESEVMLPAQFEKLSTCFENNLKSATIIQYTIKGRFMSR